MVHNTTEKHPQVQRKNTVASLRNTHFKLSIHEVHATMWFCTLLYKWSSACVNSTLPKRQQFSVLHFSHGKLTDFLLPDRFNFTHFLCHFIRLLSICVTMTLLVSFNSLLVSVAWLCGESCFATPYAYVRLCECGTMKYDTSYCYKKWKLRHAKSKQFCNSISPSKMLFVIVGLHSKRLSHSLEKHESQ